LLLKEVLPTFPIPIIILKSFLKDTPDCLKCLQIQEFTIFITMK
jgi:hypothetical protein